MSSKSSDVICDIKARSKRTSSLRNDQANKSLDPEYRHWKPQPHVQIFLLSFV